jgi:iron complex outermembrane recepter protein
MPDLETYKALIDWAVTPRYRIRGGVNRAFRAPNLGELFLRRTQIFGGGGATFGDWCSQNLSAPGTVQCDAGCGREPAAGRANTGDLPRIDGHYRRGRVLRQPPLAEQPTVGGTGIPNTFGNPELARGAGRHVHARRRRWTSSKLAAHGRLLRDRDRGHDRGRERGCGVREVSQPSVQSERRPQPFSLYDDPPKPRDRRCRVDRSELHESGACPNIRHRCAVELERAIRLGRFESSTCSAAAPSKRRRRFAPDQATIDWSGTLGCALQMQCMGYDYRVFTTLSYFNGPYSISLRSQYWPSIKAGAAAANPNTAAIGVTTSYALFALTGGYRFRDRYTIRGGIENLFDRDPPRSGGNPNAVPFPTAGNRASGATYDPLGRRAFVNLTMDF